MKENFRRILRSIVPVRARTYLRDFAWRARYQGNSVTCPCCNKSYRRFAPFGIESRKNAMCHNCGALERHRLLWLYLIQKIRIFDQPVKLLHFAPERVFVEKFSSAPGIEYYPCDLDIQNHPDVVQKMDITDIHFGDESFGAILCNHVLEHVVDDRKAMDELFRVLGSGGWAILQVPFDSKRTETFEDPSITDPADRLLHFGQHDHVRIYGRDYSGRLRQAGFRVTEEDFAQTFSEQQICRYGFPLNEPIFFCTKE